MTIKLLILTAIGVSIALVIAVTWSPGRGPDEGSGPIVVRSLAPPATTPAPTTPAPTASRSTAPTAAAAVSSPVSGPGSCAAISGGRAFGQRTLSAVRIAHQPGFDRIVFDFGTFGAGEEHGVPPFTIEQAASFLAPSGQSVPVQGNARLAVRFRNIGPMGGYQGPTDLRPDTPLVREVRLVEDFEGTMIWGVGLQTLQCPRIQELSGPDRLVVDLPAAP